jgi:hypothetical protein
MRAVLYNKREDVYIAYFESDDDSAFSLEGDLYSIYCSDLSNLEDNAEISADLKDDFICHIEVKWDGCSNIYYTNKEDKEAYRHRCGLREVYKDFISQAFVYELANIFIYKKDLLYGFGAVLDEIGFYKNYEVRILEEAK